MHGIKWTDEERIKVCLRHKNGETLKEIADDYGISKSRISHIIIKQIRLEEEHHPNNPILYLSERAKNTIKSTRTDLTYKSISIAFKNGVFDRVPNLGKVTRGEIESWINKYA